MPRGASNQKFAVLSATLAGLTRSAAGDVDEATQCRPVVRKSAVD